MKAENPIEEVWRARDELLAEHGGKRPVPHRTSRLVPKFSMSDGCEIA